MNGKLARIEKQEQLLNEAALQTADNNEENDDEKKKKKKKKRKNDHVEQVEFEIKKIKNQ